MINGKQILNIAVLVVLCLGASNKVEGQISVYDSFMYSKMPRTIKSVIFNKTGYSHGFLDSFYWSKRIVLSYLKYKMHDQFGYLVYFKDTLNQGYLFTWYATKVSSGEPEYEFVRERKAYYLSGFDTAYIFERKNIQKVLKSQFDRFQICKLLSDSNILNQSNGFCVKEFQRILSCNNGVKNRIRKNRLKGRKLFQIKNESIGLGF